MLRLRRDVPLFPGGKKKALTLSYDDGVTQDERLIELMNRYKIKGTFNINPGLMGDYDWLTQPGIDVSHYKFDKEKAREIYRGQEIAVHTMTHPELTSIPEGMVAYEIAQCRNELEAMVERPVTGMAYPCGTYSRKVEQVAKACGITYARTTKQTFGFDIPENFLEWHPTIHHTEEGLMPLWGKFSQSTEEDRYSAPRLFYLWGHSYEFDAFNQWDVIEEFLAQASGKEDIWYATNGEICQYIAAIKNLCYSATGDYIYNPSALDLWMLIDNRTYPIPGGGCIKIEKP